MSENIGNRSVSGSFVWKLLERTGTQGILLVVSLIVARILSPHEYGILAIQMIFISLANSLVQNGLNVALVQKKEISKIDYSSGFFLSIVISLIFYIIIFFCAPLISSFYEMPDLDLSLKVLALVLIINAFTVIQNAYVMRNMLFKELAISSFISSFVAGIVSIICAYIGFGLWALVIQQLLSNILLSILLYFTTKWRPTIAYSREVAVGLLKFGVPVAGSAFLDTLYSDLRNLIVGKVFSSSQLGIFERGKQFPKIITTNVSNTIQSIILPVMSKSRENKDVVIQLMSKSIRYIYLFILPSILFLYVASKPLIITLLTEKWAECIPIVQASCIMCLFWPLHAINTQTIVALGYSKTRFYTEFATKVVDIIALAISLIYFRSILGIAVGAAIASFLSAVIYSVPCNKHLSFGFIKQLYLLLPITLYTFVACILMYVVSYIMDGVADIWVLIAELTVGSVAYLILVRLFSRDLLYQIMELVKKNRNRE